MRSGEESSAAGKSVVAAVLIESRLMMSSSVALALETAGIQVAQVALDRRAALAAVARSGGKAVVVITITAATTPKVIDITTAITSAGGTVVVLTDEAVDQESIAECVACGAAGYVSVGESVRCLVRAMSNASYVHGRGVWRAEMPLDR